MRSAFRWTKAAGDRTTALWQLAEAVRWYREASAWLLRPRTAARRAHELARPHEGGWGVEITN